MLPKRVEEALAHMVDLSEDFLCVEFWEVQHGKIHGKRVIGIIAEARENDVCCAEAEKFLIFLSCPAVFSHLLADARDALLHRSRAWKMLIHVSCISRLVKLPEQTDICIRMLVCVRDIIYHPQFLTVPRTFENGNGTGIRLECAVHLLPRLRRSNRHTSCGGVKEQIDLLHEIVFVVLRHCGQKFHVSLLIGLHVHEEAVRFHE